MVVLAVLKHVPLFFRLHAFYFQVFSFRLWSHFLISIDWRHFFKIDHLSQLYRALDLPFSFFFLFFKEDMLYLTLFTEEFFNPSNLIQIIITPLAV